MGGENHQEAKHIRPLPPQPGPRISEHDHPQPQLRKMSSSEEQASAEALQRLAGMDSSHKFFKWGLFFFFLNLETEKNSNHVSEIQF